MRKHLMRNFALISLLCMVVAAAGLGTLYRQMAIEDTVRSAQSNNLALTMTALSPLKSSLADYLNSVENIGPQDISSKPELPPRLAIDFVALMHDTAVERIKIYNKRGVVVYSTASSQIGREQNDSKAFLTALRGRIYSHLTQRDAINLISTYVPVRSKPTEPILGVFEIYTNADPLVAQNNRTMLIILAGVGSTFLLMYGILMLILHRTARILDAAQNGIHERTTSLEKLSVQMLDSTEIDKHKLAFSLREGLAQTLSAVKAHLETRRARMPVRRRRDQPESEMIPVLQNAIREVDEISMELRPPMLDDLGLLAAVTWFVRKYEKAHPGIRVERDISLREEDIPAHLKIVIFRIIEAVTKKNTRLARIDRFRIALSHTDKSITLQLDDAPADSTHALTTSARIDLNQLPYMVEARERTTLSGGRFFITDNPLGGVNVCASWPV